MKDSQVYIQDIREYAQRILDFTAGYDYVQFENDDKTCLAVIRCIEVIGEAAKNVDESIRQLYPAVNWKDAARMRDLLIHHYSGVSTEIIWDTIQKDIPQLIRNLER